MQFKQQAPRFEVGCFLFALLEAVDVWLTGLTPLRDPRFGPAIYRQHFFNEFLPHGRNIRNGILIVNTVLYFYFADADDKIRK